MMGRNENRSLYYLSQFAELEEKLSSRGWSWARSIRKTAIERFAELGFPTTRLEDWRFTNIAPLANASFQLAEGHFDLLSLGDLLKTSALAEIALGRECKRAVFVNGRYVPALSSVEPSTDHVKVGSLSEIAKDGSTDRKVRFALNPRFQDEAFVALNTAFMQDGAFVEIPPRAQVKEPIFLLFVTTDAAEMTASHPRNLIIAGTGSQAQVVEIYIGHAGGVYFTNVVSGVVVGESALLEHYKLQQESEQAFHIATIRTNQERNSSFTSHSISLGGGLVRNDVDVVLGGEGAECTLNGLYVTGGRQHVDNHTAVDHARPHGTSRQLYKGILDGASSAVFNGSITVRKDAQKSDAKQSNMNLLLSEGAIINSKPQLEIGADDVRCTHGTTIGQIDPEALFYLRSRGIDKAEAVNLLVYAFANEVIASMGPGPVRARLEALARVLFESKWSEA